jgi:DNA-binding NtrC family response regulator
VREPVKRPVVLVVDDAPSLRLLCRVNLELDGYDVVEAGTLADARGQLERGPVALVVLDLHVGSDRGDVLLDVLHGREPRIPVVVVTGSAELDSGELRIDADAVLAKPFTIDELLTAVRSLVERAPIPG